MAAVATVGLLCGVACGDAGGDSTGDAGCPVSDGAAVVIDGSHVIVSRRADNSCRYTCEVGWYNCPDAAMCGTPAVDNANCGACGQSCAEGTRCALNRAAQPECLTL